MACRGGGRFAPPSWGRGRGGTGPRPGLAADAPAPAEAAAAALAALRLADHLLLVAGDVVAVELAVELVLERLAAVLPGGLERAGPVRLGDFPAHPLVLVVPGHRLEAVL